MPIRFPQIATTPTFYVSNFKVGSDADDTLSLQRAAAALQAAGGGRLSAHGPLSVKLPIAGADGSTYSKGHALCQFVGLTGVVLDLGNAAITDTQAYAAHGAVGDWAELFSFDNCALVDYELNFTTEDQSAAFACVKGAHCVSLLDGTRVVRGRSVVHGGIRANNIAVTNPALLQPVRDVELDTAVTNAYYASNVQLGCNGLRGTVRVVNCFRPLIAYGLIDADLTYITQDIRGQFALECLSSGGVSYGNQDVILRWYDRESTGIAAGGNPFSFSFMDIVPGTFRNIHLIVDILATGNYGRLIDVIKLNAGAGDAVGRGHVINRLKLSGRIEQTTATYYALCNDVGTFATPDAIQGLDLSELDVIGGSQILFTATGCIPNGRRWYVRNTYSDGTVTLHNGASGQVVYSRSTAPNLAPWDVSWVGSADLVTVERCTTPDPPLTHNLVANSSGTVNTTGYVTTGPAFFINTGATLTSGQPGLVSTSSIRVLNDGSLANEGTTYSLGSPALNTTLTLTVWILPTVTDTYSILLGEAGAASARTNAVITGGVLTKVAATWVATGNAAYAVVRKQSAGVGAFTFEMQVETGAASTALVQTPTVASGIRPLSQSYAIGGAVVGD